LTSLATRELDPELWRRYYAIMLRGLAAKPELEPTLAGPPLTVEMLDLAMSQPPPVRRIS
jgi:hypothetical protein